MIGRQESRTAGTLTAWLVCVSHLDDGLCVYNKQARDECVVMHGEEKCAALIEAHKVCLRAEGFKV